MKTKIKFKINIHGYREFISDEIFKYIMKNNLKIFNNLIIINYSYNSDLFHNILYLKVSNINNIVSEIKFINFDLFEDNVEFFSRNDYNYTEIDKLNNYIENFLSRKLIIKKLYDDQEYENRINSNRIQRKLERASKK